jgi:dihydroorotate dehydrogenase (NAD+) catalytic subunit
VPTIINIWGTTVEEYAEVARRFDALGGVGALELNVSCPNIKEGGAQFGTDCKLLAQVVAACRQVTTLPLITKMSPNVPNIAPLAKAAEDAGSDALAVTNSFPAMAIDIHTRKPKLANVTGGLTGPAIKPIAVKLVWEAAKAVKIPIIGMGGIQNADDAIEFLMAGATAVAVGTANFYEPQTPLAGHRRHPRFHGAEKNQRRARTHRQLSVNIPASWRFDFCRRSRDEAPTSISYWPGSAFHWWPGTSK